MKQRAAALLFLTCAAVPAVVVVVLATKSVLAEEQEFRVFAHQWGARFPTVLIIGPRLAHLGDLVSLYSISAAVLSLELVSAWAVWHGRHVSNITLPLATLLAFSAVVALYAAGNPIHSCFNYEDFGGCGAGSAVAQQLLSTASLFAIGGAAVCLATVIVRLPRWEP